MKFLRNDKHKTGHLAMKERSLRLTSSGMERLRPEGALSCAGRVCRLKERLFAQKEAREVEGRQGEERTPRALRREEG